MTGPSRPVAPARPATTRRLRRLLRDPLGRLRRARDGGSVTVLRLAMRLPPSARARVLRPVAAMAERSLRARPRSGLAARLAFIARRAADGRVAAGAVARATGTSPVADPRTRRALAGLALESGLRDVAIAIVASMPDDPHPALEAVRSRIAFDAGHYSGAVEHARAAVAGGQPGARALEDLARSHLAVLQPGFLPDAGPVATRLAAVRGHAVPGRVLHVVSVSLPHQLAGYTVRTQSVARCQLDAGLDARVMARTGFPDAGADPVREDHVDGVTYHRVPPPVPDRRPDRILEGVVAAAVPLVEAFRPAVLQPASNHLQAKIALALARPAGIPVVYEVRGFWEESWAAHAEHEEADALATERYRLTRAAETEAMLAADAVVTLSGVMRDEIVARGCEPGRVVVVPNAVDVDRFRPGPRDDALAASLGIGRDEQVVGYVTSLNPYEGIPCLLEAAARLRARGTRLRVLLVGDGDEAEAIREVSRRLGLDDGTLVMPGRVPHDRIGGYYSIIDVFVVPRTTDRVSRLVTPLKPYEAMALERAVVVSDLPALREIVSPEETGLTFRPEDPDDLAAVLGRLLDDPALRARLGRRAREWIAAERTWAHNGRRYRELFERLGVA